jgi:hypothetical protein
MNRSGRAGGRRVDHVESAAACGAAIRVDGDHRVGVGGVSDRRTLIDARADSCVAVTGHDHARSLLHEQRPESQRQVPVEGGFRVAAVGRGAGGVAGLGSAPPGGHELVDDSGSVRVASVVSRIDHDGPARQRPGRSPGDRAGRRRGPDRCRLYRRRAGRRAGMRASHGLDAVGHRCRAAAATCDDHDDDRQGERNAAVDGRTPSHFP